MQCRKALFGKEEPVISQLFEETWKAYEAGKAYKQRIGLYETVRRNERFYRGDQWYGIATDLPRPIFNLIRRIADFQVASVVDGDISIRYSDESIPYITSERERSALAKGIGIFNQNAAWRWKHSRMEDLCYRALLDAAISGDGVFYCWWDPDYRDGQAFNGEIRTDLIDSTNLFVSDVTSSDLQAQKYLILAGRADVESLRREAMLAGRTEKEIARIISDEAQNDCYASDLGKCELPGSEKATFLIRFFRENGEVVFEKSVKGALIRRVQTGLKRYPVAYFHWHNAKNCCHGSAPISDMIANQKSINAAYAMALKHMSNTAFSKVIYDKSRIPEWSNEIGEAIGAMGGGNIADAVSVVGVGEMQNGYLDLISHVIENTKAMMGATDSALGDERAQNTSAILALQSASALNLSHVRAQFYRCLEELALIWADMLCTYCTNSRLLTLEQENGTISADAPDYKLLKNALLYASVSSGKTNRYTPSTTIGVLDQLLEHGHLTAAEYVELLPDGVISNRDAMLEILLKKGVSKNE